MGRIRKALSITSVIATGGALGTPVKWESSAEKADKEQAKLLKEQNELLASLAGTTNALPRARFQALTPCWCAAWTASTRAVTKR